MENQLEISAEENPEAANVEGNWSVASVVNAGAPRPKSEKLL